MTPTTVYAVAVMTCWHLKPAQLMHTPERRKEEASKHQ